MSKMAELDMEIRTMLDDGYRPVTIASVLNVPVTWIYEVTDSDTEKSNTEVYSPFETINS